MYPSMLGVVIFQAVVASLATHLLSARIAFAVPIQQTQGILVTDDAPSGLRRGTPRGSSTGLKGLPGGSFNPPISSSFLSNKQRSPAEYRFASAGQELSNYGLYPEDDERAVPSVDVELPNYVPMAALEYGQPLQQAGEGLDIESKVSAILQEEAEAFNRAGQEIPGGMYDLGLTIEGSIQDASEGLQKSPESRKLLRDFRQKILKALRFLTTNIRTTAGKISARMRSAVSQAEKKLNPSGGIRGHFSRMRARLGRAKSAAGQKLKAIPTALQRLMRRRRGRGPMEENPQGIEGPTPFGSIEETRL